MTAELFLTERIRVSGGQRTALNPDRKRRVELVGRLHSEAGCQTEVMNQTPPGQNLTKLSAFLYFLQIQTEHSCVLDLVQHHCQYLRFFSAIQTGLLLSVNTHCMMN